MFLSGKRAVITGSTSGIGLAIVPRWASRIAVPGVRFVPLLLPEGTTRGKLILAAAWARGTRDDQRDALLAVLDENLQTIEASA